MERIKLTSWMESPQPIPGSITAPFPATEPSGLATSSQLSFQPDPRWASLAFFSLVLSRRPPSIHGRSSLKLLFLPAGEFIATIERPEGLSSQSTRSATEDRRLEFRRALERAREDAEKIGPEEGERPSPRAVAEAGAFAELLPSSVPVGSVWASGDGEVGFTWSRRHGAQGFLEIAFAGRGVIEWAAEFDGCSDGGSIDFDATKATRFPEVIERWIERLWPQTR